MTGKVTIELARFRLTAGTDDKTFITKADHLQNEFLTKQSGYIKRQLLKGDEGVWVDVVYWKSRRDLLHAVTQMQEDPSAAGFMQSIDPDSVDVQYCQIVGSWDV